MNLNRINLYIFYVAQIVFIQLELSNFFICIKYCKWYVLLSKQILFIVK